MLVSQESVVEALGSRLDEDTLQTFTLAEQLNANLTDLNTRIEGTREICLYIYWTDQVKLLGGIFAGWMMK